VQGLKPSPPQVATATPAPQVATTTAKKSVPPPAQSPSLGKRPANAAGPASPERSEASPKASDPLEGGWDDDEATRLSSSALVPAAIEARALPPVAPAPAAPPSPASPARAVSSSDLAPPGRPASSPELRSPAATGSRPRSSPDLQPEPAAAPAAVTAAAPAATATAASQLQGLPPEVQEQLFGVLRAALEASLVPLLEKQKELEARLETLQAEKRPMASIPVTVAPSLVPVAPSLAPVAPSLVPVAPSLQPASLASLPPKTASIVPTSYGFVIQPDAPARRPSIEVALENVGPIDMPDFGRGRRAAGRVLVGLMLAGLLTAVAATILSYT